MKSYFFTCATLAAIILGTIFYFSSPKSSKFQPQEPISVTESKEPAPASSHPLSCPCPQHAANASPVLKVERPAPGSQRIATAPLIALLQSTPGTRVSFSLFGQTLDAQVLQSKPTDSLGNWLLMLKLPSLENATLSLWQDERYGLGGMIHNASGSVAYKIEATGDASQLVITPCKIQDLICGTSPEVGLPGTHAPAPLAEKSSDPTSSITPSSLPQAEPTPQTLDLQSLPGSPNVLYLDFDGELVTNSNWNSGNPFNAIPSSLNTDASIRFVWHGIAQDYSSFNLNVTTNRAVYDATPVSKRMMVIYTDDNTLYPGISGIAYTSSFGSSVNWCCWVFTSPGLSLNAQANTGSHESGHTLGLSHDGTSTSEYFGGQAGNPSYVSWRPIMGNTARELTTWDNGSYPDANNFENDLQIIESKVGRLTDDSPGATALSANPDNSVAVEGSFRLASTNTPELSDEYTFTSIGGNIQLQARHYPLSLANPGWTATDLNQTSNLDVRLHLLDANDQVILADEGIGKRDASISGSIPAGLYKVKIFTTAAPSPTYYSTYGQLGSYSLVGSIPASPSLAASPSSITRSTTINTPLSDESITLTSNGFSSGPFTIESSASWLTPNLTAGSFANSTASFTLSYDFTGIPVGTHQASIKITSPLAPAPLYLPVTVQLSTPGNSTQITIVDNNVANPYPSTIELPNVPGTIKSIKIRFSGFSHSYVRDVRALLTSPSGKKIMLLDKPAIFSGVSNLSFDFADSGSSISSSLVEGGIYKPMGTSRTSTSMTAPAPAMPYSNSLNSLVNEPIAGTWSLFLLDTSGNDSGSLTLWNLELLLNESSNLEISSYVRASALSNQIQFTSSPGTLYAVEASDSLGNWTEVRRITATATTSTVVFNRDEKPREFYRIRRLP